MRGSVAQACLSYPISSQRGGSVAVFIPSETVRLGEATRHAVAHRVQALDGSAVTTRCGWRPEDRGAFMSLGDAVAEFSAFCCVRCFTHVVG